MHSFPEFGPAVVAQETAFAIPDDFTEDRKLLEALLARKIRHHFLFL
jgi:hypothetical protein